MISRASSFFSYTGNVKTRNEYSKKMKNESIYHNLICYDLEETGNQNSKQNQKNPKKKLNFEKQK